MMSDIDCTYPGDRDAALIGLLYGDIDPAERAAFDAHLLTCPRCRAELADLSGVRRRLAAWTPPEPARAFSLPVPALRPRAWSLLRDIPAWAQIAAALLVLGLSAGLANLNVHYDSTGLTVRTGWRAPAVDSRRAAVDSRQSLIENRQTTADATPWRADLTALERQLRTEFHASQLGVSAQTAAFGSASPAPTMTDAELLRRVKALVDDSERRQQRELALRVAGVMRDVDAQRRADLVKIDRSLGMIQNNTGVEVMKQRELLNYLVRVSQRQ